MPMTASRQFAGTVTPLFAEETGANILHGRVVHTDYGIDPLPAAHSTNECRSYLYVRILLQGNRRLGFSGPHTLRKHPHFRWLL